MKTIIYTFQHAVNRQLKSNFPIHKDVYEHGEAIPTLKANQIRTNGSDYYKSHLNHYKSWCISLKIDGDIVEFKPISDETKDMSIKFLEAHHKHSIYGYILFTFFYKDTEINGRCYSANTLIGMDSFGEKRMEFERW